jgi:XTP/dITP diphosphohydrolase
MKETLYFVTTNPYKFAEFQRLFARQKVKLEQIDNAIAEIQTFDMAAIIRDKVVKAYAAISRPVLVDHSGLAMAALKGLPQGLNNQFWDVLKDQVCDLATRVGNRRAEIIVHLGLCDGKRIYSVAHRIQGQMALKPASVGTFHLDRVFIPTGCAKTLAEMTEKERDRVSHRTKVVEKAVTLLKGIGLGKQLGLK